MHITVVGFLFHGKLYGNNSIVTLTEIGEGRKALLCITNRNGCCRHSPRTHIREWYFPNGDEVRTRGEGGELYRDRSNHVVRLNRRNNAASPTGIFRCVIPSSIQISYTIHIGIYRDGEGSLFVYCHDAISYADHLYVFLISRNSSHCITQF